MNVDIPIAALTLEKRSLLLSSKTTPKIYLTLTGYNIESNFISYTLEIGKMNPKEDGCTTCTKRTRYSHLLKLYENLTRNENINFKYKHFPPKKWFNNLCRETAEERLKELKCFVESLSQCPNILQNSDFIAFVEN